MNGDCDAIVYKGMLVRFLTHQQLGLNRSSDEGAPASRSPPLWLPHREAVRRVEGGRLETAFIFFRFSRREAVE